MAKATKTTTKATKTKSAPNRRPVVAANIDIAGELTAAATAFSKGAIAEAIAHVTTAWTAAPTERLGPIAVAIDRRLPREELPEKVIAREEAWLALAVAHDPSTLPTLLGCDWPVHPREAKARLSELVEFAPDPRIAESLVRLRAAKRYTSNASAAFWKLAMLTLGTWGEPRLAELAERARNEIDWYSVFELVLPKLKTWPAPVTLDGKATRALAALEALVAAEQPSSGADIGSLFGAVYDDPNSDGPRLVLADALLAEDNIRGEFIQLQLSGSGRKAEARIRALLRSHGPTWHDNLPMTGPPVFRRGFVAEAVVAGVPDGPPPRSWRTVEKITFFGNPDPGAFEQFITHDHLATVHSIWNISPPCLPAIANRSLDSLRILGAGATVTAAPQTRELSLAQGGMAPLSPVLTWFTSSPFAATCERLCVDATDAALDEALLWFQQSSVPSLVLSFGGFGWKLELSHEGAGVGLVATLQGGYYGERAPELLGQVLAQLAPTALSSVMIRATSKLDEANQQTVIDAVTPALDRQTALASRTIF